MPSYQDINDPSLPLIPKPSLQQYDNYQIYDLYCRDIIRNNSNESSQNILFKKFLAVERVSPHGLVECDFTAIVNLYK